MTTRVPDAKPSRIIILGALSAIAEATARQWAERGAHLVLAARDAAKLEAVAADLRLRGATVDTTAIDLATCDAQVEFDAMTSRLGGVDIVLLAYGVLGDQKAAEQDPAHAHDILVSNFTSAAAWCMAIAQRLEQQRSGALIVIGSVAGDRGRASNYVYGAAKGGLALLVQGLAHRLSSVGARAFLVKPGFVDTPMTAHIPNKGLLWAKPAAIAASIVKAGDNRSANRPILYTPGYWRLIMTIICSVPSVIFHKTKL